VVISFFVQIRKIQNSHQNLKVWGSIAVTLRQQAEPLDCMAALVYSTPAL